MRESYNNKYFYFGELYHLLIFHGFDVIECLSDIVDNISIGEIVLESKFCKETELMETMTVPTAEEDERLREIEDENDVESLMKSLWNVSFNLLGIPIKYEHLYFYRHEYTSNTWILLIMY